MHLKVMSRDFALHLKRSIISYLIDNIITTPFLSDRNKYAAPKLQPLDCYQHLLRPTGKLPLMKINPGLNE